MAIALPDATSGPAHWVGELLATRVVVGMGIGTVLAAMAALASESAPPHPRNFAVGMVQAGYPFAAVFTGLVVARLLTLPLAATLALAFALGFTLQGGYNGVWPIAAGAYPDAVRATGEGWAIGIGRSGAIIGPLMGGYLMAAKAPLPVLFACYCLPLLLCAAAAFTVERKKMVQDDNTFINGN